LPPPMISRPPKMDPKAKIRKNHDFHLQSLIFFSKSSVTSFFYTVMES